MPAAGPVDATPSPRRPGRSRLAGPLWAGVAVLVLLILLATVETFGPFGTPGRVWVNAVGLLMGGVATIVSLAVAARQGAEPQRRAWTLLCIAQISAMLANSWYAVAGLVGLGRLAQLGDAGFFAGAGFAIAGMAAFPAVPRRGLELLRMVLDGVVVAGSVLLTVAVLALPAVLASGENPFGRLDAISLMAVDTVMATVAGLLVIRGDRSDRPVLGMLAIGFLCWAATDLTRWVLAVRGFPVFDSAVPLGWVAGYAAIAIAARLPGRTRRPSRPTQQNQASPVADTVITFGMLLVAAAANAPSMPAALSPWMGVLWFLLVAAVVFRQLILIADNERLRRTLERRVARRTRELASMTQQSDLLLNSVGDGIYGVDPDGVITFVNSSAARALGYQPEDLVGQNAHRRFHPAQSDGALAGQTRCYITDAIQGRTTTSVEDTYRCADGRQIPVEVTASPLDGDSGTSGAVIVFRDITQRREVDRMKKEFVSVVSHELRTPLTAIRGSLGLLAGDRLGELTPPAARMIRIALDSTERLGRLVNDILDIERMESGSMPMDFRDHDASDLVRTAVSQLRPIATEARVPILTGRVEGRVTADGDRIVQTLVNLIGNAIKFSPAGGVVTVAAARDDHEQMIVFSVADQGRGIPADKLERIFERFEQVDSSDGREMGGSGLGLAISRSIVERHDGSIWADNAPSGGAVFRFTVPQAQDAADPQPDDDGALDGEVAEIGSTAGRVAGADAAQPTEEAVPARQDG